MEAKEHKKRYKMCSIYSTSKTSLEIFMKLQASRNEKILQLWRLPRNQNLNIFSDLRKPPTLTKYKITFQIHDQITRKRQKMNMKIEVEPTTLKMKRRLQLPGMWKHKHYQGTSCFKLEMLQYCCFGESVAEHKHCIFMQNVVFD